MSDKDSERELREFTDEEREAMIACAGPLQKMLLDAFEGRHIRPAIQVLMEHWPRPIIPNEEWISVEERLPGKEYDDGVIFCDNDNFVGPGYYDIHLGKWYGLDDCEHDEKVILWQPFPSPPTKDQAEKECENPDCVSGWINPETDVIKPCPDCQKDQTKEELSKPPREIHNYIRVDKDKVVVDREDLETLKKENVFDRFTCDVMGWFFEKYLPKKPNAK